MPTRHDVCEIMNVSLADLYRTYRKKLADGGWALEDLVSKLETCIEPHMQKELTLNKASWPTDTETCVKHHWENDEKRKTVQVGDHSGRRKPSLIFHTPGTNDFNVLALLVKCNWKTDPFDIYWNYWTAAGLVAGRTGYSYAICLELSQSNSESEAYLTSQDHLLRIGKERFGSLCNELHDARYHEDNLQAKAEVERLRAILFDDISDELFGGVVASITSR